jgi:exosortase A-associated hydrolase 2
MAALQARAFAAIGFGVLQIDLFGCGDSSGDFADARWHTWKCDLAVARTWVEIHVAAPVSLWGLRLGALLALDFARSSEKMFDQIILWQPVISGESFLTQFLRLQLANEMLAKGHEKTGGTVALRNLLKAGKLIEVAGYELAPAMATVIDGLKLAELAVASSPIHWFEIVAEQGRTIAPSGAKVVTTWKDNNAIDLHLHLISCPPFWTTQEISECPDLVSATTNALTVASS